jgi:PAS domain S-box-containing protein
LLIGSDRGDYILIENLLSRARSAKFVLQWVQDFADSWRAVTDLDPDVCLLDGGIGEGGGFGLASQALLDRGDLPLIVLSSRDDGQPDIAAIGAGVAGCLAVSRLCAESLERAIYRAIERKGSDPAPFSPPSAEHTSLAAAIANLSVSVLITDPKQPDNPLVFVNPAFTRITGYEPEEVLGRNPRFLTHPDSDPEVQRAIRDAVEERVPFKGVMLNRRKDGSLYHNSLVISPVFDERGELMNFIGLGEDVTEQVQAERKAAQLAAIVEGSVDAIKGKTLDGIVTSWNAAAERMYGYTAEEMIGQPIARVLPPDRLHEIDDLLKRIRQGEQVQSYETVRRAKDGTLLDIALTISPIRDNTGKVTGAATIAQDIRWRKEAEAQLHRQIMRIQALRNIDMAIAGSLDLRVTLNVLLDQVTTHLHVDSAAVLLLNPHTQRLEYTAGRGFRTTAIQRAHLRIGECVAGRAAIERRVLNIPDLSQCREEFTRMRMIAGEGFVSYWVVPLITKGRVEGVLEVFHRASLPADGDWLNFLEALAGQTAIAIENAALFNDLQRSNLDLQVAYDTTLEGWSKALDLRDKETEGHTIRVTEATMILARAMNIPDDEIIHMRRGALLHDIGKMGIPDSILLKPGPLTDEEWAIMKKHPVYAYELLSPIQFLRPALDIPYCHHERWDGGGYPRGLKGEQIPLSARIFAVVDVWDALSSDRPYRPAWTADRVRDHIARGSGSHFEPRVAEIFLNMDM